MSGKSRSWLRRRKTGAAPLAVKVIAPGEAPGADTPAWVGRILRMFDSSRAEIVALLDEAEPGLSVREFQVGADGFSLVKVTPVAQSVMLESLRSALESWGPAALAAFEGLGPNTVPVLYTGSAPDFGVLILDRAWLTERKAVA